MGTSAALCSKRLDKGRHAGWLGHGEPRRAGSRPAGEGTRDAPGGCSCLWGLFCSRQVPSTIIDEGTCRCLLSALVGGSQDSPRRPSFSGSEQKNVLSRHPVEAGFTMPRGAVGLRTWAPHWAALTSARPRAWFSGPEPPAPLQLDQDDNADSMEQE